MAFWKRASSKTGTKTPVPKSSSCPTKLSASSSNPTTRGPLAGFIPEEPGPGVDLGHSSSWTSTRSSRLSKTLQEFLSDPAALGYLIQYLEGRDAAQLVHFYLHVHSFRCSASTKLTGDHQVPASGQVDSRRLERVPEDDSLDLQDLDEASSSSSRFILPSSPSLHSPSSIPDNSGSVHSLDSGFFKSESDSSKVDCESRLSLIEGDFTAADFSPSPPSEDVGALPSEHVRAVGAPPSEHVGAVGAPPSEHVGALSEHVPNPPDQLCADPGTLASSDTFQDYPRDDQENQRAQALLKNRTEDAVKIYRKYISPESTTPIHIPVSMTKELVELICDPSGLVPASCFDNAQVEVLRSLETEYFPDFLESGFHAKHQVDVLTGSGSKVHVTDILFNDMALFHLMEFMEAEGQRPLIEFWMAANNFQHSFLQGPYDDRRGSGETTHDAMILYDKFFSMQATSPLGFDDKVRLAIENNICQETGPVMDCFVRPMEIIVEYLEARYLHKFLNSKLFHSYVKELISSIQSSTRNFSSVGRSVSTESLSSLTSDNTSRVSNSGASRNTLLAGGDKMNTQLSPHQRFENMRIDYGMLTDPDSLWKRNPIKSKVGKVDYLGRYHSSWEQAPDLGKEKGLLGKAVRRLGRGDQVRLQEEMAWQLAEMFVKDVTSITLNADNSPEAFQEADEKEEASSGITHENSSNINSATTTATTNNRIITNNVNNNPYKTGVIKKSHSDNTGLQCV